MKFERGAGSGRKASACRILCGLNGHSGKISVSRQSGMVVNGSGPRWLHPYPGWTKIDLLRYSVQIVLWDRLPKGSFPDPLHRRGEGSRSLKPSPKTGRGYPGTRLCSTYLIGIHRRNPATFANTRLLSARLRKFFVTRAI